MNNRYRAGLENLRFFLSILLVFLLIFEKFLRLPALLAVFGRMHPLILHFPVTLAAVGALGLFVSPKSQLGNWARSVEFWSITASITAFTALCGLFLSREGGYDAATLNWHKYSAAALTLFAGFLAWHFARGASPRWQWAFGSAILLLTLVCGHQGGVLTHGSNFLLEPIRPAVAPVVVDLKQAEVFRDAVRPVLEKKCFSCHNPNKTKGELLMTTLEGFKKGGENGAIFVPFNPDSSHMIQMALLPESDDLHMPPQGKPQLTSDELKILHFWIKKGADFGAKVTTFLPNDTLEAWVKTAPVAEVLPKIATASAKSITALNSNFCNVRPIAQGSPYLEVLVFNHQDYRAEVFKKLQKISKNIYRLEASGVPVTDKEIKAIASLNKLRELGLGKTKITGKNLAELRTLTSLKILKLHGNTLSVKDISPLLSLPKLQSIYLWGNLIEEKDLKKISKKAGKLHLDIGTPLDTATLQLNKPVAEKPLVYFQNSTQLVLNHPLRGVNIRYTTDGQNPDGKAGIGQLYKGPLDIKKDLKIKYRAELASWHPSMLDSLEFKQARIQPDKFELKIPANSKFKGGGDSILFNLIKGSPSHTTNDGWLGFERAEHLDVECVFKNPAQVQKVSIGSLLVDNAYILPPVSLEVWGTNTPGKWEKIGTQRFAVPSGPQYGYRFFDCPVKPGKYAYLKIVSKPNPKLPNWHGGKGQPGWLFVDEVLIN